MADEQSESLDNIRRILEEGRFQEAIDECRALLFEDPTNVEVLALLRQANEALESDVPSEDTRSSRDDAEEEDHEPESLEARLAREFGDAEEGDDAEAAAALGDDEKERVEALLKEGEAAFDRGKLQQAIDIWSRVYIVDLNNKKAQKLIEKARVALEEDQRKWDELIQEGNDLLDRGEYDQALATFHKVLEASPNHGEAQDGIDRVDLARREVGEKAEKAKQMMSKAAKLFKEGNLSEAIYTWEKVLEMEPDNARARQFLGEARKKVGEPVVGGDRFAADVAPGARMRKSGAIQAPRSELISSAAYGDEAPIPEIAVAKSPLPKFLAIAAVAAVIAGGAVFAVLQAGGEEITDEDLDIPEVAPTQAPTPSGPVEDVVPPTLAADVVAALDKELATRPVYVDARKAFQEGRFDEAATYYKSLAAEVPDNELLKQQIHRSIYNSGVAALRSGDLAKAASAFREALALNADDSVTRRHLAAVERYAGKSPDDRIRWYAHLATMRR